MERHAYKCSVTGRFVSQAYANANPATTYRVTLKRKS